MRLHPHSIFLYKIEIASIKQSGVFLMVTCKPFFFLCRGSPFICKVCAWVGNFCIDVEKDERQIFIHIVSQGLRKN